jgi:hypothetical protein
MVAGCLCPIRAHGRSCPRWVAGLAGLPLTGLALFTYPGVPDAAEVQHRLSELDVATHRDGCPC